MGVPPSYRFPIRRAGLKATRSICIGATIAGPYRKIAAGISPIATKADQYSRTAAGTLAIATKADRYSRTARVTHVIRAALSAIATDSPRKRLFEFARI